MPAESTQKSASAQGSTFGAVSAARLIDSGVSNGGPSADAAQPQRGSRVHERKPSYSPISSFASNEESQLAEEDDSFLGQSLASISEFFASGSNQVVIGLALSTVAAVIVGVAVEAHSRGSPFGTLLETLLKSVGLFELGQATSIIGSHSRVLANLLQIVFTVSAIAVQLAASR